ncbi:GGDEF domain-containing protein [Actinoplanes bogorensis]|uniref:GGDEF domain-containing protein n=1 Tax=Paractinoplanes bogorensis TaxID=1610840 RepID=A0ABS5YGG0_9ACTN|nr:GGDEF domain-containing protein [Actinoplanes bogorensis]
MPNWRWCLAAGTAATAVYVLLPDGGRWHAIAYALLGSLCVAGVVFAVRVYRPHQPTTWYTFVGGLGVWLAGSVINRVTAEPPWPAITQVLDLAGYPLVGWALAALIRGRARAHDRTALIDGSIVATSLALLYWSLVVGTTTVSPVQLVVALGDVMLFMLGSLLITTPGARTVSYRLLLTALLLTAIADISLVVMPSDPSRSGPADVLGLLGNVLVATAALHPSMRRLTVPPANPPRFVRPRLILLAVAVLLAPAVNLYDGLTGRPGEDWLTTGVATILLFALVTARMAGLVHRVETQSRELEHLAGHDALTGLPNRRRWDDRLTTVMAGGAATLIVGLLDLDHFKAFNDTRGHQAGDDLLAEAAAAWRACLRPGDLLARYGGEEFGLLITGGTLDEAVRTAERLLRVTPYGQTFSAGLTVWDGRQSPAELLHRADELLYASKQAGRARISTAAVAGQDAQAVEGAVPLVRVTGEGAAARVLPERPGRRPRR